MEEVITKEEFAEWKSLKVTQAFRHSVESRIKDLILSLGDGHTLNTESVDQTALKTARCVGLIEGLRALLDVDLEG